MKRDTIRPLYVLLGIILPPVLFVFIILLSIVTEYYGVILIAAIMIFMAAIKHKLGLTKTEDFNKWLEEGAHKTQVYSFFVGAVSLFILGALGFLLIPILMILTN